MRHRHPPRPVLTKRQRRAAYTVLLLLLAVAAYFAALAVLYPSTTASIKAEPSPASASASSLDRQGLARDFPHLKFVDNAAQLDEDEEEEFDPEDVHIVFSTGCNLFQHWQAEVLLHSHWKVGQPGKITRVVSGCDTEHEKRQHGKFLTHPQGLSDQPVPLQELQKSSHPAFRLHVTPSFPGAKEFPWINKPMGLRHWLEHADPPVRERVIIVLDPDMVFMDRFELDGKRRSVQDDRKNGKRGKPFGGQGILMSSGQRQGVAFGESVIGMTDRVRRGRPVAQTYGLGGHFVHALNASKFAGPRASKLNSTMAAQHYSVGPPMMAHVDDMRHIFSLWTEYMQPVFDQNPGDIQADMYAYSFAAAEFNLPHAMFDHYMVSSPQASGEAWPFVRNFKGPFSCRHPNRGGNHAANARIPTLLHNAQRCDSVSTPFMFHKGHVAPNILSCDLPLLVLPPDDIIEQAPTPKNKDQMYMMCNAYNAVNDAVLAWKQKFCVAGKFNAKRQIVLNKRGQQCKKEEMGKTCWDFARTQEQEQKDDEEEEEEAFDADEEDGD